MTKLTTCLVLLLFVKVSYCSWCDWSSWTTWSTCSQSCPGGTNDRVRYRRCYKKWTADECYTEQCNVNQQYHDTKVCGDRCENGGTPENPPHRCQCTDELWGVCCQNDCPVPKSCVYHYCDSAGDEEPPSVCMQCKNTTSKWNSVCNSTDPYDTCDQCQDIRNVTGNADAYCYVNGSCQPRCNWLGHDCWPGTCDTPQYLASSCQCIEGFNVSTPNDDSTTCSLTHKPEIHTCNIRTESEQGEIVDNTFTGNTTSCENAQDAYIKFIPKKMAFKFEFMFKLPVAPPSQDQSHAYIHDYSFGIIEAGYELRRHLFEGSITSLLYNDVIDTADCNYGNFSDENPSSHLISCNTSYALGSLGHIEDGERLCQQFEAVGSGFVRVNDLYRGNTLSNKRLYNKILNNREVCFILDLTPPAHCITNTKSCDVDLLQFGNRVRNTFHLFTESKGWVDPDIGSKVAGPSGINHYELTIYNAQHDMNNSEIYIDTLTAVDSKISTDGTFEIDLPIYGKAHMFGLYLTVVDNTKESGNYQMARRMILVDNTSYIETDQSNPIQITSAAVVNTRWWQTNLWLITMLWSDHFYNTEHRTSNFLWPIRNDTLISPEYDQIHGDLPVNGTLNVHGIVNFQYAYHRRTNNVTSSDFHHVPYFESEFLTLADLYVDDGDQIDIDIKPWDIMNNTYIERVTVHVDSSPPIIESMGLFKDGYKYIYVHSGKDLSHMDMRFDTFDTHSGISEILWSLGHTPTSDDIGSGAISVERINGSCTSEAKCYCPIIGSCQRLHYGIDLNSIISDNKHEGAHNKEYHFGIRVQNEAGLKTEAEYTILVDYTVPELGVALDGPPGSNERNFQSNPLLVWNWHGFVDHESGISKYHFAVGRHCFSKKQLINLDEIDDNRYGKDWFHKGDTTMQFSAFEAKFNGFYRISVIAFNNAMDPSEMACSSGITFDTTPPVIKHIDLIGVRGQESIACTNASVIVYISPERRMTELGHTEHCSLDLCDQQSELDLHIIETLQNGSVTPPLGDIISEQYCRNLPLLNTYGNLFLPSDNIWILWEAKESESEILDFYVGLSSSKMNTDNPDIRGYQTTHNRMQFKCVHCGLGEGDIFYVMIKVTNKAGLSNMESIGPIIIDMTPPIYQGSIEIMMRTDDIIVKWDNDSFIDTEDNHIITEYYWSLGTQGDAQSVERWKRVIVDHNKADIQESFFIQYPKSSLQQHGQDRDFDYVFTIKAVNRAGLHVVRQTDPIQIHSKVVPSCGLVFHIEAQRDDETVEEIGYQERNDTLCVAWHLCVHDSDVVRYRLGIGTTPTTDDVLNVIFVNIIEAETMRWCFEGLKLAWRQYYYVILKACNGMGCSAVSSKGVFIAQDDQITHRGIVTDGAGCSDTFTIKVDSNVVINETLSYNTTFDAKLTVVLDYTLKLVVSPNVSNSELTVSADGIEMQQSFWTYNEATRENRYLFYSFRVLRRLTTFTIAAKSYTVIKHIEFEQCNPQRNSQVSTVSYTARWSFTEWIHRYVSHYELNLYDSECTNKDCYQQQMIKTEIVGKHLSHTFVGHSFFVGHKYNVGVSACFGMTCASQIISDGLMIDPSIPLVGFTTATIKHLNGPSYYLAAEWEPFVSSVSNLPKYTTTVYDWAISLAPSGGSILTSWTRIMINNTAAIIELGEVVELHIHQKRSMYLVIRPHPENGVSSIEYIEIKLLSSTQTTGIQIFDINAEYDTESMKSYLHSSNVGVLENKLHNSDVDYTSDRQRINAVALGTMCNLTSWHIQLEADQNCERDPFTSMCIDHKKSKDNTVEFRRQHFQHKVKYYICGYIANRNILSDCPPSKACSNGFILDTEPPRGGSVTAGRDSSATQSDNTIFDVQWAGFVDLESEIDIPYASGIYEYYVSLGTTPNGQDIVQFESVGHTSYKLFSGLCLYSGTTYYASVKACDHVGLCTSRHSNGVLIDATPPMPGNISLTFSHFKAYEDDNEDILVHYEGFHDHESGISYYELGVGTTERGQNIKPFTKVDGGMVSISGDEYMVDGHSYYVQIKAVNRVRLWTIVSSEKFIYDSSPPVSGVVRWGRAASKENLKYTTYMNHVCGYWMGYRDSHTGIAYYRYGIGSSPGLSDVLAWQDVGLHQDFETELHLKPGLPYYLTVEACNGIYLCTRASSSAPLIGDQTVPFPGIVHVGMGQEHEHYQSNRYSISVKWFDFHDIESGIKKYHWCVGTTNQTCDIIAKQDAHLSEVAIKTGLDLPVGTELYASVEAINYATLVSKAISSVFLIDTISPYVVQAPQNIDNAGLSNSTRFDRSYISYSWKFLDDMSPISEHIISLAAHYDGFKPLDNVIVGDISTYTYVFDEKEQLRDGSVYTFKVVACDAASLCISAISTDFLLDSSPPHLGGFMEPMYWRHEDQYTICHLLWTGFTDPHSDVIKYNLIIGNTYNGDELSGGILEINHDDKTLKQECDISIHDNIELGNVIYLTLWAVNGVGLKSEIAKTSVLVHSMINNFTTHSKQGSLKIEKHSCIPHYCTGDCTCAALGQTCTGEHLESCKDLQNKKREKPLKVFDGLHNIVTRYSPSTACLAAFWTWNANEQERVQRFECSVSAKGFAPGVPIFDVINEKHWFDTELQTNALYCLPKEKTLLQHSYEYVFHVRAWYNATAYITAQSSGVFIEASPPRIQTGQIVRQMNKEFAKIIKYTTSTKELHAAWDGVFTDAETGIDHYDISFGSSQGGNEVFGPMSMQLQTNISLHNLTLTPGFKYFTTIHAFNRLAMVASMISDGFIVDTGRPIAGVIHTTRHFQDKLYQNGNIVFTWQGFYDKHSYIDEYLYLFSPKDDTHSEDGHFSHYGIQTKLEIDINLLDENISYYLHLKARDAAGFYSDVVSSSPVIIDKTPPKVFPCTDYKSYINNTAYCGCHVLREPGLHQTSYCTLTALSLERLSSYQIDLDVNDTNIEGRLQIGQFWDWLNPVRLSENTFRHTSRFLYNGQGEENITLHVFKGNVANVQLSLAACLPIENSPDPGIYVRQVGSTELHYTWLVGDDISGIKRFLLGIGTTTTGYQLMKLTDVGTVSSLTVSRPLQHGMLTYATLIAENNAGLREHFNTDPLTIDWTGPLINDVETTLSMNNDGHYAVSAIWNAMDGETGLTDCLWNIGTAVGKSDLLNETATDTLLSSRASVPSTLEGGDVYIQIRCHNTIGLYSTVSHYAGKAISHGPQHTDAHVAFIPKKETVYETRDGIYQSSVAKQLQFTFNGFEDVANITGYSYLLEGSDLPYVWKDTGVVDTILVTSENLNDETLYTFRVLAKNSYGFESEGISSVAYLSKSIPALSGKTIELTMLANNLILDWSHVFIWESTKGALLFEIQVGPVESSALFLNTQTFDATVHVSTHRFVSPGVVFCVLTAVTPSGTYVRYQAEVSY